MNPHGKKLICIVQQAAVHFVNTNGPDIEASRARVHPDTLKEMLALDIAKRYRTNKGIEVELAGLRVLVTPAIQKDAVEFEVKP
jgi:hypothetical protein